MAPLTEPAKGEEQALPVEDARATFQKTLAVMLVVAGALLLLRAAGVWSGDAVMWPVALGAFGSAVIWVRADESSRARWSGVTSRLPRNPLEAVFTGPVSRARVVLGALLITGGMAAFLVANSSLVAVRNLAFATAATIVGLVLIVGPGMWRLGRQLTEERRERIRSEERAQMAAHLHDSVLQSLAMIQRASTSQEMATLARGQERELRAWLYGRIDGPPRNALSVAMEDAAARIENLHHVKVEAVTVGDAAMDERLHALVQAAGEALTNAARHAGVGRISLYVEVEPESVTAYIRDRGRGFDPRAVPPDRRGIADSIRARMDRAGGRGTVASVRRKGTEVKLWLPREKRG